MVHDGRRFYRGWCRLLGTDLEWYARDVVVDCLEEQREEIAALRAEVRALDSRIGELAHQIELVRLTNAGGDDGFWLLKPHGEGHTIVGPLKQYKATIERGGQGQVTAEVLRATGGVSRPCRRGPNRSSRRA